MRNLVLSLTLLLSYSLVAQDTIPNQGFEQWQFQGNYEDPTDWGTINPLTASLNRFTAQKSTDAHSGDFALKLVSQDLFGQSAPGIAATGTINAQTQDVDGGFPITSRPDAISGWYKYAPNGADSGSVNLSLYKWDAANNQRMEIGQAVFSVGDAVNTYTRFEAPVTYSSTEQPDSAVIVCFSTISSNIQVDSEILLDDLAFEYTATALATVLPLDFKLVKNGSVLAFDAKVNHALEIKVLDTAGKLMIHANCGGGLCHLRLPEGFSGIGIYQVTDKTSGQVAGGKFYAASR